MRRLRKNMKPETLIGILRTAGNLKDVTRHSYTAKGRHESVAEHCWHASFMAYFLKDEFPDADISKVILMCIMHDIGEAFTGDIPSFNKTPADEAKEDNLLCDWVNSLPEPYRAELAALYAEMSALETAEAKLYKAIDNFEAVLQHNEADLSTWIPKEYELNLTYGDDKAAFSPYMVSLRQAMRAETEAKISGK